MRSDAKLNPYVTLRSWSKLVMAWFGVCSVICICSTLRNQLKISQMTVTSTTKNTTVFWWWKLIDNISNWTGISCSIRVQTHPHLHSHLKSVKQLQKNLPTGGLWSFGFVAYWSTSYRTSYICRKSVWFLFKTLLICCSCYTPLVFSIFMT